MRITFDKYDKLEKLSKLKKSRHQRNKHPKEQIERLALIMKEHGVRHAIHISRQSGEVCFGHGRWEAAKLNGWKEFPVVYQDFASDEEEYACVQSDNAIAFWAELDLGAINSDLADLGPDFDIDLLGIEDFVLEPAEKFEPLADDDEVPEAVDTRVKPGDIWQLGRHRLMCGSCTDANGVDQLFDGDRAGMTFTSPPYNAAKDSFLNGRVGGFDNKYQAHTDDLSDDDYAGLLKDFTALAIAHTDYVFVNLQMLAHNRIPLIEYQHEYKDLLKDILIWNKSQCPPNIVKGAFNTKWEYVFCFSNDRKTRGFPVGWQGKFPNVVETESNSGNEFADVHKAGFPVSFPLWFLEKLDLGDVYDPFGGTGSTLIACEKTNRRCFMMELDPKYCDVIVARWEKYTGKTAERITEGANNGETAEAG